MLWPAGLAPELVAAVNVALRRAQELADREVEDLPPVDPCDRNVYDVERTEALPEDGSEGLVDVGRAL